MRGIGIEGVGANLRGVKVIGGKGKQANAKIPQEYLTTQ